MKLKKYVKQQKGQIKQEKIIDDIIEKGGYCILCGYNTYPLVIRKHHIAGKNNNDITIPVCPTCHDILSLDQKAWPEDWTKKNNPPEIKIALLLRSLSELDKLRSELIREISDEMLNGEI